MTELNKNTKTTELSEKQPLVIDGVIWRFFANEMPEPYRDVMVNNTIELIKTKTYKHGGKLMLKDINGDGSLIGFSPKLLYSKSKWCYL